MIELVRRRRLVERYALLWMAASIFLVVLAVWDGGLVWIADALGILSPPNALFLLGLATVVALALHFSVAFSRLSEETKILAQEVARLDGEQRRLRGTLNANGGPPNGDSPQTASTDERRTALVRVPELFDPPQRSRGRARVPGELRQVARAGARARPR